MKEQARESLSEVTQTYVEALGGIRPAARFFGVSPGLVHYTINHEPRRSSKIARALVKRKAIEPTRIRLSADLDSVEQREALKRLASNQDKSWSEYCRWMAGIMEKA